MPDDRQYLRDEINRRLTSSLHGQKWWSFANGGATILVILFSSIAAVLPHTPFNYLLDNTGWSTLLSVLAAILAAIRLQLSFERKWVANRMTESALDQLSVDLNTNTPSEEIKAKLKDIISTHNKNITGYVPTNTTAPAPPAPTGGR